MITGRVNYIKAYGPVPYCVQLYYFKDGLVLFRLARAELIGHRPVNPDKVTLSQGLGKSLMASMRTRAYTHVYTHIYIYVSEPVDSTRVD